MISIPWSPELWVTFILENCIAVLVNDTFKRIAIDVVHIAIYYICNIPFIEIQENTVSNEMAGVTVFS